MRRFWGFSNQTKACLIRTSDVRQCSFNNDARQRLWRFGGETEREF